MKSNTIQLFAKWDSSPDHSTNLHSFPLITESITFPVISTIAKLVIDSVIFYRFFIDSIQTKQNMCERCCPEALSPQALFVDDACLNYSTQGVIAPDRRSSAE